MSLLQMSVSASVLIAAVVIIRALALYRLPKRTFLFLWGVGLCRLLIPFSVPSRLSIYTGIDILRWVSAQPSYPAARAVQSNPAIILPAAGTPVLNTVGPLYRRRNPGAGGARLSPSAHLAARTVRLRGLFHRGLPQMPQRI